MTAKVRYGRLLFPYARQIDGVWHFLNPFTDEVQPFADQSQVEVLALLPEAAPLFAGLHSKPPTDSGEGAT